MGIIQGNWNAHNAGANRKYVVKAAQGISKLCVNDELYKQAFSHGKPACNIKFSRQGLRIGFRGSGHGADNKPQLGIGNVAFWKIFSEICKDQCNGIMARQATTVLRAMAWEHEGLKCINSVCKGLRANSGKTGWGASKAF